MKKCVAVILFLFALVTGTIAFAKEPVYGVMFQVAEPYRMEVEGFTAEVPQVDAVSAIDGQTPLPECDKAAKAVNKALRTYVDKAYKEYKEKGKPDTWIYFIVTKNGDNLYSLLLNKEENHENAVELYQEAFTFLQNTGERVTWQDLKKPQDEKFMTTKQLEKNIRDGQYYRIFGEMPSGLPDDFPGVYILDEMPGPYEFYIDSADLIIFLIPFGTERPFRTGYFEVNSGAQSKYSRAVG